MSPKPPASRLAIEAASVPLSAAGQGYLANAKADLRALLTGGDDYQTLFTAPASARDAIAASGQTVTRIGRVEQGEGVGVLDASGAEMTFDKPGWRHFSE